MSKANANADSKHATTAFADFDDMFGAVNAAANKAYEPQTDLDSDSGYDTVQGGSDGSGSDEESSKKSKKKRSVKPQKDNTLMVKTPLGDGPNAKLMGKLQESHAHAAQFSNQHDVTGKQTITIGDGKPVHFHPLMAYTKSKGFGVAMVAQFTVPQAFTSQSKHSPGAAARTDRIAKEPKTGEVRGEKLTVYYNQVAGAGSICVNRKQLCSMCFVSDKAFAKITAGNAFHTSEISLSEHDTNIPVVSVELATFMLLTVAPTTATYNLYKTVVEGITLRQNVCWNQWFVSMLNKFVTAAAISSNSSDGVATQMKQFESARVEINARAKQAEAVLAKQMTLNQKAIQTAQTVEESIKRLPDGFKQFVQAMTVSSSEDNVMGAMSKFAAHIRMLNEANQKAKAARAAGGVAAQNATAQAPKRAATVVPTAAANVNLYAAAAGAAGAPVNDVNMG